LAGFDVASEGEFSHDAAAFSVLFCDFWVDWREAPSSLFLAKGVLWTHLEGRFSCFACSHVTEKCAFVKVPQWSVEMVEEKKRPEEVLRQWWNDSARIYAPVHPSDGMVAFDIIDALRGAGYVIVSQEQWRRMLKLSRVGVFYGPSRARAT
jgi:hypothetical protein